MFAVLSLWLFVIASFAEIGKSGEIIRRAILLAIIMHQDSSCKN